MIFNRITKYIKNFIFCILCFIPAFIMYDFKYLRCRYFKYPFSKGWSWVLPDMNSRILFGINRGVPWPVSPKCTVNHPENIIFDKDDLHIFQVAGTYYQGLGAQTIIGKGTWIAYNVGLITANHDIYSLSNHSKGKDIVIGEKCWIGMNVAILPGVNLGANTIVGAGSVVTKSFPEGNVVIGGNPANIIRKLK